MTKTIIKDGTGTGFNAKIDNTNRMLIRGPTVGSFEEAMIEGKGFFISSGIQTLTSTSASFLLYIKNNDDRDLQLSLSVFNLGVTTGGVGDCIITSVINPTAGTLIDSGSTGVAANARIGSATVADIDILTGVEGSTITDGIQVPSIFVHPARTEIANNVIVPKGVSLAFGVTPPAGNTSMGVQLSIQVFFVEKT